MPMISWIYPAPSLPCWCRRSRCWLRSCSSFFSSARLCCSASMSLLAKCSCCRRCWTSKSWRSLDLGWKFYLLGCIFDDVWCVYIYMYLSVCVWFYSLCIPIYIDVDIWSYHIWWYNDIRWYKRFWEMYRFIVEMWAGNGWCWILKNAAR